MKYRIYLVLGWLYSLLHIFMQTENETVATQRFILVGAGGLIVIVIFIWLKFKRKFKKQSSMFSSRNITMKFETVNNPSKMIACGASKVNRFKR